MKEILKEESDKDVILLKDVNPKYIYAGLDRDNNICIATCKYEEEEYIMQLFVIGSYTTGFTEGNGYAYEGLDLKSLIKRFMYVENTKVYEFTIIKEFLEWALSVVKE